MPRRVHAGSTSTAMLEASGSGQKSTSSAPVPLSKEKPPLTANQVGGFSRYFDVNFTFPGLPSGPLH
jgi:hypothetical protein